MNLKNLIEKLRTKKSRDNRELLDSAANAIENLYRTGTWSLRMENITDNFSGAKINAYFLECSECGRRVYVGDANNTPLNWAELNKRYPFCHCGAYMQKEMRD